MKFLRARVYFKINLNLRDIQTDFNFCTVLVADQARKNIDLISSVQKIWFQREGDGGAKIVLGTLDRQKYTNIY